MGGRAGSGSGGAKTGAASERKGCRARRRGPSTTTGSSRAHNVQSYYYPPGANVLPFSRKPERVEWLYAGSGPSELSTTAAAAEDYLLGRRRFEPSLQETAEKPASHGFGDTSGRGPLSISSSVNSHVEYETRLREDPLLVIKQREIELRRAAGAPLTTLRDGAVACKAHQREKVSHEGPAARQRSKSPPHGRHRVSDGSAMRPSRGSRNPRSHSRSPEGRRRYR